MLETVDLGESKTASPPDTKKSNEEAPKEEEEEEDGEKLREIPAAEETPAKGIPAVEKEEAPTAGLGEPSVLGAKSKTAPSPNQEGADSAKEMMYAKAEERVTFHFLAAVHVPLHHIQVDQCSALNCHAVIRLLPFRVNELLSLLGVRAKVWDEPVGML